MLKHNSPLTLTYKLLEVAVIILMVKFFNSIFFVIGFILLYNTIAVGIVGATEFNSLNKVLIEA